MNEAARDGAAGEAKDSPPETRTSNAVLTEDVRKLVLRLGLPVMIGFVFATLLSMADRFFVSLLPAGETALAAVGCAFALDLIVIALGSGLSQGTASSVARQIGAGHYDRARRAGAQALLIALLLAVLLAAGSFLAAPLMGLIAATPQVHVAATEYATVMMLGAAGWLAISAFSGILRGEGDTKTPMKANLLAIVLNLILNPLFIFDFGLGLGVFGAALATVVARMLAAALLLLHLTRSSKTSLGRGVFLLRVNGPLVRDILKVSLPSSCVTLFAAVNLLVVLWLLGDIAGEVGQAAFLIGYLFDQFAFLPVIGLAVGLTTVVGQNHGAGLYARERAAIRWCATYAVAICLGWLIVYLVAAPWLVGIYTTGEVPAAVHSTATEFLRINAFSLPFIAVMATVSATFSGRGRGMPGLLLQALRMFGIGLPLFFALQPWGLPWFWLALPISALLGAAVSVLWLRATLAADPREMAAEEMAEEDAGLSPAADEPAQDERTASGRLLLPSTELPHRTV